MIESHFGLENHGLKPAKNVYWNPSVAELMEFAVARGEGLLTDRGALAVLTGARTGRSPNDKFIVKDAATESTIDWGKINQPMTPEAFDKLRKHTLDHMNGRDLFVKDAWVGADKAYGMPLRVVTTHAYQGLFCHQVFRRPAKEEIADLKPEWLVLAARDCTVDPAAFGTNSGTYILADFARKLVVIGGSGYAGEIKKSIFTAMNYVLPTRGVFPMHCSANVGDDGNVALFFGLSGTGKTTLSADPERRLIGDDEHGWSDRGIFNFEGGCYAKCINLSAENEPQIFNALKWGAVLENVVLDDHSHVVDLYDLSITENTRAGYPLEYIDNAVPEGRIDRHPSAVVFLTCDAFGVLPPIARLTPEQAMYHFLSGYTAKLAGTEAGIDEPQATFSTGFGQPFLPRDPMVYAKLLAEKLTRHGATCYFINTGWCGGPYGVGKRIDLPATRAIITAALSGRLADVPTEQDPVFGLRVPASVPGVSPELLTPRKSWPDGAAYDRKLKELAALFVKNFRKFPTATTEVKAAGPRV
jgi:phosphoenolpyruvate carboxykinase (ATP)